MDELNEDVLHHGLNPGGSCMRSRLDDVGADVQLRAWFADLADENMNSTEGDLIPIIN